MRRCLLGTELTASPAPCQCQQAPELGRQPGVSSLRPRSPPPPPSASQAPHGRPGPGPAPAPRPPPPRPRPGVAPEPGTGCWSPGAAVRGAAGAALHASAGLVPERLLAVRPAGLTPRVAVLVPDATVFCAGWGSAPPADRWSLDDAVLPLCRPDVAAKIQADYGRLGQWPAANQLPIVYMEAYNIRVFGLERLHPFDASKVAATSLVITPEMSPFPVAKVQHVQQVALN